MYCLLNMCYVCLEKKDKSLIDVNSSLSVHKDILHIIGYLPFNLAWLKTKRIILICEECCRRLRETYQLLVMCLKNSAVLQGYMEKLNNAFTSKTNTENEVELHVTLNNKQDDINKIKCEIKSEDEEIYIVERGPIIQESEEVFVNIGDHFVKEEDTWKRDEIDDKEEPPMDNNSTGNGDNETDSEIFVHRNTHNTASDSSGSTSTQGHTTNKKKLNTPATKSHKCLTCSKSFRAKSILQVHARVHTGEKPFKCATCEKGFSQRSSLVVHMRIHTGEKPYGCSSCNKSFRVKLCLVHHMHLHTGEKSHKCSICEKGFSEKLQLVRHMRTHTGEKPYKCFICERGFSEKSHLVRHMRTHTGQKPYECSRCKRCFINNSKLVRHMRTHTGEKPSE